MISPANAKPLTHQLIAEDLTLFRGERCLFSALNFALEGGQLLQLEGSNGSGKTSLLRVIAGLLDPEEGVVRWDGEDSRDNRQAFLSQLAWLGHKPGFKLDLTPVENLRFETSLRPQSERSMDEVFEKLQLTALKPLPLRSLSAGQQRRVALARLMLSSAPLWILDEPYTNLDKAGRELVDQIVQAHVEKGGLCLLASHQAVEIDVPRQQVQLS